MQAIIRNILITCVLSIIHTSILNGGVYPDHSEMTARISSLEKGYPALCSVAVICKTAGGMEVFAITIGAGETEKKPGIAIIGGIDGRYIHSREIALAFAEEILMRSGEPEIRKLLEEVTFYILPDVMPDASAQYFSKIKYERNINAVETDDDRDFSTDEDPVEDLNGDGMITLVRIEDPSGSWLMSPDDPRVMIIADPAKGEKGGYIVANEGYDNDEDGLFNEDGAGGVAFNANFSHNYEEFGLNSGAHALSEIETRAVADFLFDHFNIYMTVVYGPQDNLSQPMKGTVRPPQRGKKPDGLLKNDESVNKLASDLWKKKTGMKGSPANVMTPGNFAEWAYYDYGRYSFTTPGWWVQADKSENSDVAFLKREPAGSDNFVPWTKINSSRFGGRQAEVGGIKPFATIVPPDTLLSKMISDNFSFITALASYHPELELIGLNIEKTDDNLWRVSVKAHNSGIFATCSEIGDKNKFTRRAQLTIDTAKEQIIISGQRRQALPRLEGNQAEEYSWLIMGKGNITITAGAVNCGISAIKAELK